MSLIRVFQIVLMDWGRKFPLAEGEWWILLRWIFLSAWGHFRRSAFDHSNLFQIKKYYSVNLEHQLKLKLFQYAQYIWTIYLSICLSIYLSINIYMYAQSYINLLTCYDFLRILLFLEIWIIINEVGVGNILFIWIYLLPI